MEFCIVTIGYCHWQIRIVIFSKVQLLNVQTKFEQESL
jgi:hypothetical protein